MNKGPPRGLGDSGRRAIYFQGFGEKGNLFSGIWGESVTFWGFREQRKNILGSWGERSFKSETSAETLLIVSMSEKMKISGY